MASPPKQYSAEEIFRLLKTKKSDFWVSEGRKRSLALFHNAAERVPAYKDFLRKNGIPRHSKVKTWDDFQTVPVVDKNNYLRQYPLEKLCWDGTLKKPLVFTATSGSTGEPFYFPRDERMDWQSSIMHEMFLQSSELNKKKSTLVIVCFGMGVWIGGLITYEAFRMISQRGYPLTIITPGANKKEIFEIVKNIGKKFDQLVLCGYPPFIKDVVDDGSEHGIAWKDFDVRIVFAAEPFSEQFRRHILKETGIRNRYTGTMNIYGTADLGTMAQETPVSVLMREIALQKREIFREVFNDIQQTPTLAQFNPLFVNFESVDGVIVCTSDNALPLIRYAIGDRGGVLSYREGSEIFSRQGCNIKQRVRKETFADTVSELPFTYVYERTDLATKLYGAIIYPEHIKAAMQSPRLKDMVTGKFTMVTQHDKNHDQYLEINIELKRNMKAPAFIMYKIRSMIVKGLLEKNAEYKYLFTMIPDKVQPKVTLWEYEHPRYFKSGAKQKWVKK